MFEKSVENYINKRSAMFIVAITGGIATGKSTVAKVFRDADVPVVDADQIAREGKCVRKGSPGDYALPGAVDA